MTPRAQEVLGRARGESARLDHRGAGTGHLLLALVALGSSVSSRVLLGQGLDPDTARRELGDPNEQPPADPGGSSEGSRDDPGWTDEAKDVLDQAAEESRSLGHAYVGTEHLLLSVLAATSGDAARILRTVGVDVVRCRWDLLSEQPGLEARRRGRWATPGNRARRWFVALSLVTVVAVVYFGTGPGAGDRGEPPPESPTITSNLHRIALASNRYFIDTGEPLAREGDIVGLGRPLEALPGSLAGEDYRLLFPVSSGFTQLEVSKADGGTVRYRP